MKRLVRDGVVYMQPVYQACKIQCAHPREFVNKIYCMDLLAGLCASATRPFLHICFLDIFFKISMYTRRSTSSMTYCSNPFRALAECL